jgi:hypothetical protein
MTKRKKQPEDEIVELQKAYMRCFKGTDGETVMEDLERRNWTRTTTMTANPYITAFNEGQRSVMLYIRTMLELTPDRIRELREQLEELQDTEPQL